MVTQYRHLSLEDRIEIARLKEAGHSQAEIARRVGVHRSTINRELARGAWQPANDHANLRPYLRNKLRTCGPRECLYIASQAHTQAMRRSARSHQSYTMKYDPLVDWVITALGRGWSPEEIAGRLPLEFPDDTRMRVCHETLYQWIYSHAQHHRGLWQYLARAHKKRRKKTGRRVQTDRIKYRVPISHRPPEVDERCEFGHWESDSVLGLRGTGGVHTSVERASRFYVAIKLPALTAQNTVNAQIDVYSHLPPQACRSVTTDNGSEFAYHYQLADTLAIPTFFADPYSAWQRGSNEHFNGRLRKYFPKGTNFNDVPDEELADVLNEINNRPRKILGWKTPAEEFHRLSSN